MPVQPKIHCEIIPGRSTALCSNPKATPALTLTAAEFDASDHTRRCGSCENARKFQRTLSAKPGLREVAQAVADFLSGPKDRFGRVDAAANDQVRDARERIRGFAVRYDVTSDGRTYIDQCAAVLRAAIDQSKS